MAVPIEVVGRKQVSTKAMHKWIELIHTKNLLYRDMHIISTREALDSVEVAYWHQPCHDPDISP